MRNLETILDYYAIPGSRWEHKERPCSGKNPGARRELLTDTAAARTQPGTQLQALRVAGPPCKPRCTVTSSTSFSAEVSKNSFEDFSQHLCLSFFFFFLLYSFLFLLTEHFRNSLVTHIASTLIPPSSLFQNGVYRKMWSSNSTF